MINILFDCPNLDDFRDELMPYFPKESKVCVIAFSFYDDYVYDADSWERVYGRGVGNCYFETVDALKAFGIPEENVSFINYFTDTRISAIEKIKNANIIFFTGGLPDKMMARIREFGLIDVLRTFDGTVAGYSAGAVIQLNEYHLYPDGDYSDFGYYDGLGYINDIYFEVHYEYKPEQDESIRRFLSERDLPLYVSHTGKGGIVYDNGKVKTVGRVDCFNI